MDSDSADDATADLELTLHLPEGPLARSMPAPVRLVLRNLGTSRVVVNRRLAPGYRDSISREVFFDMTSVDGTPEPIGAIKYDREFATPAAYVTLNPGEQVEADVDLLRWCRPRGPGHYSVVARYQADEPLASPPPGIARGTISSPRYSLVVE
jgi:hypothetical protein